MYLTLTTLTRTKVRKKLRRLKIIIDTGAIKRQYFKKLNLAINITSTSLIAIGAVAGAGWFNIEPSLLGSISGAGLALKTFSETKDYKCKIEISKFAYTTYQKVLLDLRTALRGGAFYKGDFLKELNILDDTAVDFFPLVTKFEK